MADTIFGQGLNPVPLELVDAVDTGQVWAKGAPLKVSIDGLGGLVAADQGAAVADATVAADGTSASTQLNALLASLRAAGIIAT